MVARFAGLFLIILVSHQAFAGSCKDQPEFTLAVLLSELSPGEAPSDLVLGSFTVFEQVRRCDRFGVYCGPWTLRALPEVTTEGLDTHGNKYPFVLRTEGQVVGRLLSQGLRLFVEGREKRVDQFGGALEVGQTFWRHRESSQITYWTRSAGSAAEASTLTASPTARASFNLFRGRTMLLNDGRTHVVPIESLSVLGGDTVYLGDQLFPNLTGVLRATCIELKSEIARAELTEGSGRRYVYERQIVLSGSC